MCNFKKFGIFTWSFLFAISICVFVGSFSFVAFVVENKDTSQYDLDVPCANFPQNVSHIKLEKGVTKMWHSKLGIEIDGGSGMVESRCSVSRERDFEIIFNNVAIGRTQTLDENINLVDCHNTQIYKIESSDDQSITNTSIKIYKNDEIIYSISTKSFFSDEIELFDINSTKVASLKWTKLNNIIDFEEWLSWNISIVDPINRPVDPFLLISIASKHKTFGTELETNNDICTEFSIGMIYVTFISLFVIGLFCFCIISCFCKKNKKKSLANVHPEEIELV